ISSAASRARRTASATTSATSGNSSADRHSFHRKLDRRTGTYGLYLIRAFLQVFAGHGPSILPEQRANIENAGAAPVQVGFKVGRELLHAAPKVQKTEVSRA